MSNERHALQIMPTTRGNRLECIEEGSSISSSDDADFSSGLCKQDISELSLNTNTTDCVNLQNSSINIDNSNDVVIGSVAHFHGPVSIYQSQNEVSVERLEASGGNEGKLVKSESVSSEKSCSEDEEAASKKLRTLFIILSLLVVGALISIVVYFTITTSEPPPPSTPSPDGDLGVHRLIYRDEWGGRLPNYTRPLTPPVKYVIISHSAGGFCSTTLNCAPIVRDIQTLHVSSASPDIGYNFLIGGDGNIYVGRDWYARNFHMDNSIGVCFLGNYVFDSLTDSMIEAAQMLLELGLQKEILSEEYKLIAHNQTYTTLSPGENVYKVIKEWPHFYPGQVD